MTTIFERAINPETYLKAVEDPGSAIKNVVSDPAFGLVAGLALGPAGYGLTSLQAAMAAGGISALATGSLQKGLSAGMSAYGGAGLSDSFMKAGEAALPGVGSGEVNPFASAGRTAATEATRAGAEASALDKISAGFGAATSSSDAALQFAKDNYGKALMAAGPILADKMVQTKTALPTADSLAGPSYIRPYAMTRKVRQPEKDIGSRQQSWFDTTWERGEPYKAANGGIVALAGGGMTSQDAYDFLMGKKSDTDSTPLVNTVTKAPAYEGRYEYDPITGTSRWVPARTPMIKPVIAPTTDLTTTPTTNTSGITTLVPNTGNPNAAAMNAAAFAKLTPAQLAQHQAQLSFISNQKPVLVQLIDALKNKILFKAPNEPPAPVVNMDTLSPNAIAEGAIGNATSAATNSAQGIAAANAAAAIGKANAAGNAGATGTSSGPGGMAGTVGGPGVAASVAAGNAGAAGAAGPGSSGGGGSVGGASGMGGMGTGAAAAGVSAGVSGVGPGGVGGASGGNVRVAGGLSDLGSYSDGGRLLRGPGDGVSDSIPAMIGKGQPARLADGEFVIPARIVSEIGNGSTEAGARKLYKMMDRIQAARGKTVGKGKVAKNTRTEKYLPA